MILVVSLEKKWSILCLYEQAAFLQKKILSEQFI